MLAKARYAVLLAVGFGLVASYSVYRYLLRYDDMVEAQEIATQPVVTSARELARGSEITADDLRLGDWPIELFDGHHQSTESLVGRINEYPIARGAAVLVSDLAPEGAEQGLAATIPAGYRAMTVPVTLVSGVSGFVLPGSRVDVLVSIRAPGKREPTAKTILQNLRVLAVDQQTEGRDGRPRTSRAVTLEVTPTEAEKLGLASTEGTLLLSLRNRTDQEMAATSGINVAKLIGADRKAPSRKVTQKRPAAVPVAERTRVDVIRGTKRSTEELDD